jgi:2-phosphosulfolactate phosphatase
MISALDVAATPAAASSRTPMPIAVVIDVLRATSTIVTALDNGAAGIIPVREVDEAIGVMRRIGRERVLLCGERRSRSIEGFDLDNSPASYTRERVAGKTLVLTTTNGTRALADAARDATIVYCAALSNRAAVVRQLAGGEGNARLHGAGSEGEPRFEDILGAGAIVDALVKLDTTLAITDAARAAATVYAANAKRLTTAIASGSHARSLIAAGFADDIAACARIDVSACVPLYSDGIIGPPPRSI